jgi:alpha-galactosidase
MSRTKFDYYIRSAMLSSVGFSYDLPSWPIWCIKRLKEHVRFFKEVSKKYFLSGNMYRLTDQALRGGKGDRFQAYQYFAEDGTSLIMAYKLSGAQGDRTIHLEELEAEHIYKVQYIDQETVFRKMGKDMIDNGIVLRDMIPESSEIIIIE